MDNKVWSKAGVKVKDGIMEKVWIGIRGKAWDKIMDDGGGVVGDEVWVGLRERVVDSVSRIGVRVKEEAINEIGK